DAALASRGGHGSALALRGATGKAELFLRDRVALQLLPEVLTGDAELLSGERLAAFRTLQRALEVLALEGANGLGQRARFVRLLGDRAVVTDDLRRQVRELDPAAAGHHDRAAQHLRELLHVARE